MNTSISISVTSKNAALAGLRPNGVTITYGINMIPEAQLQLPPESLGLLCNFEQYRREPLTIFIQTVNGCIRFDGLADGLSFSQSVGHAGLALIVKSKFQVLNEVMAKHVGLHPTAANLFSHMTPYKSEVVTSTGGNIETSADLATKAYWSIYEKAVQSSPKLDFAKDAVSFTVAFIRTFVESQLNAQSALQGSTPADISPMLRELVSDKVVRAQIQQCSELLKAVDTTATKSFMFNATNDFYKELFSKAVQEANGSIFTTLHRLIDQFDAVLVVGNNKMFTVPKCSFLSQEHITNLPFGHGRWSSDVNTAYPSQYEQVSFGDNGYVDIRGVYVSNIGEGMVQPSDTAIDVGYYKDEKAKSGGLMATGMPYFAKGSSSYVGMINTYKARKRFQSRGRNFTPASGGTALDKVLNELETHGIKTADDVLAHDLAVHRFYGNEYAKSQYFASKYTDRTGSISLIFTPYWAPGGSGVIYTRTPGIYIDFYTTVVTHTFSISPPNVATATTSVGFNSGRIGKGAEVGTGLDQAPFYLDFTAKSSYDFAKKFVNDLK